MPKSQGGRRRETSAINPRTGGEQWRALPVTPLGLGPSPCRWGSVTACYARGSVRLARCPATPSGAENGAITSPLMATGFSLPIGLRAGTLRQTLHWPGRWQYPIGSLRHRAPRAAANAPAPDLTRRRRRRRPLQDSSGSNHSRCQLPLVCCIMDGGTLEQLILRANFRRSRATHCCGIGDGLQPDPSNVHLNVGDW